MKKSGGILLAVLMGMIILFSAGAASAQGKSDPPIVLRVADFYPPNHPIEQVFKKYFMAAVEQRSNGRIKFDYYGNETLLKNFDIAQGVMNGIADIGNTINSYQIWPISSFYYLPGAFGDKDVVKFIKASWPVFRKYVGGISEPMGLRFIIGACTTNYQLAGRGEPPRTASLRGIKIRTSGTVLPYCITLLGGTNVGMSITEAYDAMDKGVLSGISLAIPSYKSYQFQELLKWAVINADFGASPMSYGMNIKKLNSLPPDLQKIIIDVGNEATVNMTADYAEGVDKDLASWRSKGVEIIKWSAAEKEKENAALKAAWTKWIADESKKYPSVKQLVSDWADNLAKEGIPLSQYDLSVAKGK